MKIIKLTNNRIILQHRDNELRIEASNNSNNFKLYFSPNSKLKMPRNLVVGKRKMIIE